jgi:hypothetical protein
VILSLSGHPKKSFFGDFIKEYRPDIEERESFAGLNDRKEKAKIYRKRRRNIGESTTASFYLFRTTCPVIVPVVVRTDPTKKAFKRL